MEYDRLLQMSLDLGCLLLSSGAEIYGVEESMNRILQAYGVKESDVFAVPNCVYVTITTPEGHCITKFRRILRRFNNLDRVDQANDLCRRLCRDTPELSVAVRQVKAITARPTYNLLTEFAGYALLSFSFTLFWGGTWLDACWGLVCGIFIKSILQLSGKLKAYDFFTNIVASAAVALVATTAVSLGWAVNYDKIIIGALMSLVPGIAITTFMRDIMAGDLMAGLQRLTEGLLVATAIAVGVGLVLMAPRLVWGV